MVSSLIFALLFRPVDVSEFNDWAVKRDVASIEANSDPSLKGKFQFLKGQGAFGVGRYGWQAKELPDAANGKTYLVFTTQLTTQDYGDQVFELVNGRLTRLIHERETLGVQVNHLDMDISFNLEEKKARILCQADLKKSGKAEGSFFLRLGGNYVVQGVADSTGKPVKFSQAGGVICLPTPSTDAFSYRLLYEGIVDKPRFAGAITKDEVMLTNDYWWPAIGRLPCSFTTTTSVPKGWIVVGQGDQVGKSTNGPVDVYKYDMKVPVCFLSLSAGKFNYESRMVNGIKYFAASRELTNEDLKDQLEMVPPVIEFFSQFAPHPFKEYGAVDTRLYGGGALEAYSYATYGTGWLPDEDPHEPSHTWWGGLIPNTYLNSFWNESFAVFSEGLYSREGAIGNIAEKRMAFVDPANASPAYNQATCEEAGAESGGIASALGYGKGGMVLQQLELEMGHERMMEVCQKWLKQHKVGEPGDWKDFEAVCGPEWKWFFDQWIRRTGWPEITVLSQKFDAKGVQIDLRISKPVYRFKVEVSALVGGQWKSSAADILPDENGKCSINLFPGEEVQMISLDSWDRLLQPARPRQNFRWSDQNRRLRLYLDPSGKDWTDRKSAFEAMPQDLSGVLLIGHPESNQTIAALCKKAGFVVSGNNLTYKGTTIDLSKGAAVAMVEFEPGKWCGLSLGKTRRTPKVGAATVAIGDEYGRFLRGQSYPRQEGPLVFKNPKFYK